MKNLDTLLLKGITDAIWFITIICYPLFLISPFIFPYFFPIEKPNEEYFFWLNMSLTTIKITTFWTKFLLFINVANLIFIVLAFKNFRQLLINFNGNIIFEKSTELLLKKTGRYLFFYQTIFLILDITVSRISKNNTLNLSYLFIILLSLFFYVLAELFEKARKLKEENELTI